MADLGKAARRLAIQQRDLERVSPGYGRALMARLSEGSYRGVESATLLQTWIRNDWTRLPAKERSELPPAGKPSRSRAQRRRSRSNGSGSA